MSEPDPPVGGQFPQYGPPSDSPPPYLPPAPTGRSGPEPFDPIEAFKWSWRKFTEHLGPVFIGVAIYLGVRGVLTLAGFVVGFATELGRDIGFAGDAAASSMALDVVGTLVQAVLYAVDALVTFVLVAAGIRAALDVTGGHPYDFITALKRIPLARVIGANLLVGLIVVAGGAVSLLPGVALLLMGLSTWVAVGLMVVLALPTAVALSAFLYFTIYVVVDQAETGVIEAIRMSARLVQANLGDALLMGLLSGLVMVAGFLACCIGLVVAYPVSIFAATYTYRAFGRQAVAG